MKKEKILELSKKEEKSFDERMIVCSYCVWAYGDNECVRDGDCMSPKLTGLKPNWIWKLIETPVMTKITDINGNIKNFEYSKFYIDQTSHI